MSKANLKYISQPDEIAELQEQVGRLKAIITRYAKHDITCTIGERIEYPDISPCTCGFSLAFKTGEES